MQVGQLVTQLVTTYDGTGFNKFQSDLLRGVQGATSAAKQFDSLNKSLENMRQSSDAGTRGLGYILSTLNLLSPEIDRVNRLASGLGGTLSLLGKGVGSALSGVVGAIQSLVSPMTNFVARALSAINPLNLISSAIQTAGRVGEIAFGVLIGNALTELTQKAIGFVSALAPLQTGLFAGEIGTQLKALAVTASNAGLSFEQVRGSVNGVRILGIEASEAIKSISQGFQVGLNPSQIQELARAAQDMAVVIGTNSSEAFNRLFQAIVSGNSQLLRFAGIMKTQDQIIQDFSRTSGKSVSEIRNNVNLLRQAFFQGIIQEARQFAGAYEASLEELGKRLSSFPRTFNDLRLGIGRIFEPFLAGAFSVVEETTESLSRLFFVTKRGALENAAAQISQGAGISITAKQLSELQIATIKGGDEMEAVFAKVAAATGAPIPKLRELAAAGAFSSDAISKIGHAFEPTALGEQLRGLSFALGSIVQGLAKSFFALVNGGQASLQAAIPTMVQDGIQFVANLALGITRGLTQYVIPGVIKIISTITQILVSGAAGLASTGLSMAASLTAGLISGITSGLVQLGSVISSTFTSLLTGLAGGLSFLGDVKNWGKDIPGAATEGVNEGKFDLMAALEEIRKAAMASFANDTGPADIIGNWGRGIVRSVLESLKARDFTSLNFLEGIIKSIFGQGAEKQAVIAVNAVAQALADLNATGAISASSLTALGAAFGAAFGDVQRYLAAVNEMNIGLDKQEQLENDVEDATDAVQAAQERLRQFEEDTAGIPERYTRGRRAQLQTELDAAQKEQEKKRDALRDQQKANEKTREAVELQRALIQELVKAAETQAKINQDAANTPVDPANVPTDDIDAQLKRIGNEFRAQLIDAFAPVRDQFLALGDIIRGFLGIAPVLPEPPDPADFSDTGDYAKALTQYQAQVAEQQRAVNKGQDLRNVLNNLMTVVIPGIQTAFEKVKTVVSDIYDFILRLTAAAQGFVAALTGGSVAPGPQDSSQGGQRDPKATENADALAGFSLGQKTLDILNTIKDVLNQVKAFAAAHPNGVKIVGALALADIATGGALHQIGAEMAGSIIGSLTGVLVLQAGPKIAAALSGLLGTVLTTLFSPITTLATGIWGTLTSSWAFAVTSGGGTFIGTLTTFFATLPAQLSVGLATVAGLIIGTLFYELIAAMTDAPSIGEMIGQLQTIFENVGAGEGWAQVMDVFWRDLVGHIVTAAKAGIELLAAIPLLIWTKIAEVLGGEDAKLGVANAILGLVAAIQKPFDDLYNYLVGNSLIPDLVGAIVSIMAGAAGLLAEPMASLSNAIIGPIQSAADSARGLIASITGQEPTAPTSNSKPPESSGGSKPALHPAVQDNTAVTLAQINAALSGSPAAATAENTITKPITASFADLNKKVGDEHVPGMGKKVVAAIGDMGTKAGGLASLAANNISQPIEALQGKVKNSMQSAANDVVGRVNDMLKPTVDLKNAFSSLGTVTQTAMKAVSGAVSGNLTTIKSSMQGIAKEVIRLIEDVEKAFKRLGQGPVLKAIGDMMETMLRMFRRLFDELVGHSIVPDLVDGIVGEFQDLDPRTKNPLMKFTTGVENTVAGIDGKMKLSGKGLAGGGKSKDHLEINVNQQGWVFPATMDAGQQDALRKLAREEAYTGITLAFTKAGAL